jgi:GDPmannose 4,6-dehydratase
MAFKEVGIDLEFKGNGLDEKAYDIKTGKCIIEVDPKYFRPTEVELLLGDYSKAREKLNWQPKYTLDKLVKEMVEEDMQSAQKATTLKAHGYEILVPQE